MKFWFKSVLNWLPQLNYQIWILAAGRLLSQIGTGFTLFYAPIFFVNHIGLSAASVGIGLGSASLSGIVGRILGGSFTDSRFWGRKRTLLLSAAISAIADGVLALAADFPTFVVGNLIMGLGIGLYWPATEAAVADLSQIHKRNEAYALTRLADNIGLGMGVVWGGVLINLTGAYRALFVIDGISFVIFFGVIYWAILETSEAKQRGRHLALRGWLTALRDQRLLIFVLVNILFTTYLAQVSSTLPLYFRNVVRSGDGFATTTISLLFTWHVGLTILCQLPVTRALSHWSRPRALMLSDWGWAVGFFLVWAAGLATNTALLAAGLGVSILALATVVYNPVASSLVADFAPDSLRGIYLSINSLCWAIGYFIGPAVGGAALDLSPGMAKAYWLGLGFSTGIAFGILQMLHRKLSVPQ